MDLAAAKAAAAAVAARVVRRRRRPPRPAAPELSPAQQREGSIPGDRRRRRLVVSCLVVAAGATRLRGRGGPRAVAVVDPLVACPGAHAADAPPSSWRVRWAFQGQEVLRHIAAALGPGAPVVLTFGTLLHEVRNGTAGSPSVCPDVDDKDFDVAVFPRHFPQVLALKDEIKEKFGWNVDWGDPRMKPRLYVTIYPDGHNEWDTYQIDVYGFTYNRTTDLIHFPWDRITVARDVFLPVRRHKTVFGREGEDPTTTGGGAPPPHLYLPYDPPCLLANLYGADYMTPAKGPTTQANWGTRNGRPAYHNPRCTPSLTASEQHALEEQLGLLRTTS